MWRNALDRCNYTKSDIIALRCAPIMTSLLMLHVHMISWPIYVCFKVQFKPSLNPITTLFMVKTMGILTPWLTLCCTKVWVLQQTPSHIKNDVDLYAQEVFCIFSPHTHAALMETTSYCKIPILTKMFIWSNEFNILFLFL